MAAAWRLARVAVADLESIFAASLERWGELGRARYAARPGPLTHAVDELAVKGVKAPVHVVSTGAIEVARVLYERVEPTLHFAK
jgi:plasmid stabilization system protein ParE